MSKKYGLPTYPIHNGMDVGYNRSDEELEWLLDHGYLKLDAMYSIRKDSGLYGLLRIDECLGTFESLNDLIGSAVYKKRCKHSLPYWQWFEKKEEE